jgi:hypothetical protein
MPISTFTIKKGDLRPVIQATLRDAVGVIDLTNASGVSFVMNYPGGGSNKVNAAGTIVTAASGIVKYTWTGTDTDTAGTFDCEWEIDWGGGVPQTVPSEGYDRVIITEDLD